MPTLEYARAVVELADCEDVSSLSRATLALLGRELGLKASLELWDLDGSRIVFGAIESIAHRTWIGARYTIGALRFEVNPSALEEVGLLATQLVPLAELLLERDAARRRTIREDISRLYKRRIREELVCCDWNVSAVAKQLRVSRARVADVARRWRNDGPEQNSFRCRDYR